MTIIHAHLINVRNAVGNAIPKGAYATHGIDHYPAKMVPHLARYAIDQVSCHGEFILDPFCGCGTVQVESLLMGRNAIGIDVNPIAVMLAKAKTTLCSESLLVEHAYRVIEKSERLIHCRFVYPPWLGYWFSPLTLQKLLALSRSLCLLQRDLPDNLLNILRAALIISVRKCSRADPRSPKPFISKKAVKERVGRHFDAFSVFAQVSERIAAASADLKKRITGKPPKITTRLADAKRLRCVIADEGVDAVVTSPPYLSAQDYYRSCKLEMAVMGLIEPNTASSLGSQIIGSGRGGTTTFSNEHIPECFAALTELSLRNKRAANVVVLYMAQMRTVLQQLYFAIKGGRDCCLIVGDSTICGVPLPIHEWLAVYAEQQGFCMWRHEVDTIKNRRVPPQRQMHTSVIPMEHLLFLRKKN